MQTWGCRVCHLRGSSLNQRRVWRPSEDHMLELGGTFGTPWLILWLSVEPATDGFESVYNWFHLIPKSYRIVVEKRLRFSSFIANWIWQESNHVTMWWNGRRTWTASIDLNDRDYPSPSVDWWGGLVFRQVMVAHQNGTSEESRYSGSCSRRHHPCCLNVWGIVDNDN